MRDALGSVQSVLVLGGNSEIAVAIVDRLVEQRCKKVLLGVRSPASAATTLARLRNAGAEADAIVFDALDSASHEQVISQAAQQLGDLDMIILAFGVLGAPEPLNAGIDDAVGVAMANYVGSVSSGMAAAQQLRKQGHGILLAISSVAGVRARADNFVYGSSKSGMDQFAQGLGDALMGSGARVIIVRPGFVHTKMTEGMKAAPFATTPDAIADVVIKGIGRNKRVIWAPPIMGPLFTTLRHLPNALWRKLARG